VLPDGIDDRQYEMHHQPPLTSTDRLIDGFRG
jgi:hypothetical protein